MSIHTDFDNGYSISNSLIGKGIELALIKSAKEDITRENTSLIKYIWLKLKGKEYYSAYRFIHVKEVEQFNIPLIDRVESRGLTNMLIWEYLNPNEKYIVYDWARDLPDAHETMREIIKIESEKIGGELK